MSNLLTPTNVNTVGLLLDIIGALLLFKYGLPPDIDPSGHIHLILEQEDEEEKHRGKIYIRNSRFAVALLILGFALQAISNYL